MTKLPTTRHALATAAALICFASAQAQQATLTGWALMPANTFSDGPTSGQFNSTGLPGTGGNPLPLTGRQSVQGFSAVLAGPTADSFLVMPDNGFGTQGNSADALLRMYAVRPDWRTAGGGAGTVTPVDMSTGATRSAFDATTRITLSDPNNLLGQKIQADYTRYYNGLVNGVTTPGGTPGPIDVDPAIRSGRLLTGADFDIESVRRDKNGNYWYGDEFGPYLVKTNARGEVLKRETALPGVFAPQNPAVLNGNVASNLNSSNGFEGMAINPAGDRLYTLLEGAVTVNGTRESFLRINEFDVNAERYTGAQWRYKLDAAGTNIGDMTAINDHEFLVIERNGATATGGGTPFKRIYRIDIAELDADGNAKKTLVADLMNIADPNDLNGDGSTAFTFPYVTIESVLVLDPSTLLVINDNNYPGTGGRNLNSDPTEFLRIRLASPVPEAGTLGLSAAGLLVLAARARRRAKR